MAKPSERENTVATVCDKLVRLASEAAQERWMVKATKDEYLLPDDLLNDAFHVVESIRGGVPWVTDLDERDRDAILRFGLVLESEAAEMDEMHMEWVRLVRDCAPWAAIRTAARQCLSDLGFDLSSWEQREVHERPARA
jgi:hypothetical protein